jgi:hypothetical protein
MGVMFDPAIFAFGILFLINGVLSIFYAEQYVRYVTSLYSVKTVRVMGWIEIVVAFVLMGFRFGSKRPENNFLATHC